MSSMVNSLPPAYNTEESNNRMTLKRREMVRMTSLRQMKGMAECTQESEKEKVKRIKEERMERRNRRKESLENFGKELADGY